MIDIPYVNPASAVRAREWEQRFQKLPPQAGIIFVGVTPTPTLSGECDTYDIYLGIDARFEKDTGLAVLKKVLAEEMGSFTIRTLVLRGAPGACRDKDAQSSN
jgi:hypothetical protein